MSTQSTSSHWIFIVDTDEYAGNFEREMVAHMTGQVGDCEVGDDYAADVPEDIVEMLASNVRWESEDGCSRPASIWLNEADLYNSVALFLHSEPIQEELFVLKQRALDFPDAAVRTEREKTRPCNILGYRLLKYETTVTQTETWRSDVSS